MVADTSLDQLDDSVPIKLFAPLSFAAVPVAGRSVFQLISALSKSAFLWELYAGTSASQIVLLRN
jgi:hypothetical protein